MVRIVAMVLGVLLAANGVVMLFAGLWWYGVVPGVTATGPFNPHFVRDIGADRGAECGGGQDIAAAERTHDMAVRHGFLRMHGAAAMFRRLGKVRIRAPNRAGK